MLCFNATHFFFHVIIFISCILNLVPQKSLAENTDITHGKNSVVINSESFEELELCLGGLLQADYRYYFEKERADNRFDIRRARLKIDGQAKDWFHFSMQYEFQGNDAQNLIDAFGNIRFLPAHAIKFGQFKMPFSLEWQSPVTALHFAERSMGYYLSPQRDIGVMFHGDFLSEKLIYAVGLFNGDGIDGSATGNEHDDPELAARIVAAPFVTSLINWLKYFQLGGSFTQAKIDITNVNLNVKSTGMAGLDQSLYSLNHRTKFGILFDVGDRLRHGIEAAWAFGPVAVQGEYFSLKYTNLKPSGSNPSDADFSVWYTSILYIPTGENPVYIRGKMKALHPKNSFNPAKGHFGALCLAGRIEHFAGDKEWIAEDAFISVENADAVSLAITWILNPVSRFLLDYTYTDFSDPLKSRELKDGTVEYIEKETVLTSRFSIAF